MGKNITLRIADELLKKCRHAAVEENKSLSEWVADQIERVVAHKESWQLSRERALRSMKKGLPFSGGPLSRDEVYED